jgi:hypothetical protein
LRIRIWPAYVISFGMLAPSDSKAARKKRRQRERARRGEIMLPIAVNENDFIEALMIRAEELGEPQATDRAELARIGKLIIAEWPAVWLNKR